MWLKEALSSTSVLEQLDAEAAQYRFRPTVSPNAPHQTQKKNENMVAQVCLPLPSFTLLTLPLRWFAPEKCC